MGSTPPSSLPDQRESINEQRNDTSSLQSDELEQMRKLFIGGLDYNTSEETLKRHFNKFGVVIDCVVMRDPQSKRSRGFGFVIYANSSMVDNAQNARPHEIDGREVQSKRAIPREDSGKPEAQATVNKVYLGGLSNETDESELREYFKDFGNIININIVAHKDTGRRRGFAFVEYDDYDPVDKIVLKKFHTIKDRRVEAKKAIPKTEMDARIRISSRNSVRGGAPGPNCLCGRVTSVGRRPMAHQGCHSPMDGYPFHYSPSSVHYSPNWMLPSHAAAAAAAAAWHDYSTFHPTLDLGSGLGPLRHVSSFQHRGYRPYTR